MSKALFGDTVTLYHREAEESCRRIVLQGVQWRQKTEKTSDGSGKLQMTNVTSVTIPDSVGAGIPIAAGDVMVLGKGPKIEGRYTIASLKKDSSTYCTVRAVADNTLRPRLKHRKVAGV